MCWIDNKGQAQDCGKCICQKSAQYDQHNKVATGETVTVGVHEVKTYKCTKGCGQYVY